MDVSGLSTGYPFTLEPPLSPRDGSVQPQSHRRTSAMLPHYNQHKSILSWTYDDLVNTRFQIIWICWKCNSHSSEYKIFYYKKYKIQNDKLYYTDTDNNSSQNQDYISFITLMPIEECRVTMTVYNITVLLVHSSAGCDMKRIVHYHIHIVHQLFIYFFEYLSAGPSYLSVRN